MDKAKNNLNVVLPIDIPVNRKIVENSGFSFPIHLNLIEVPYLKPFQTSEMGNETSRQDAAKVIEDIQGNISQKIEKYRQSESLDSNELEVKDSNSKELNEKQIAGKF